MDKMTKIKSTATSQQNNALMKERLDTFINWTASNMMIPQELAKGGFHNTHRNERAQCTFCFTTGEGRHGHGRASPPPTVF